MKASTVQRWLRFVIMATAIMLAVHGAIVWAQSQQQSGGQGGVLIKEIVFIGNTVIDTETLQKTVKDFINRELTLEDMSELADLITTTYQEKGYILARAYLPEQEIKDGLLKIGIAEGRIGKVVVSGKTHYHDRVVKRYFKEQEKKGVVNEDLLEKGLLYSKENEDIETEVVLKGGEKPGTVDVVLDAKDKSKVTFTAHAGFDYNNYGSELVGADRYGFSLNIIDHNWGSKWDFRGVVANNAESSSLGLFDVMIPVNSYGTQIGASYLDGDYLVGQELADLGLGGRTTIFGLKALHPIFKKKNKDLKFTLGYDHKYSKNYIVEDVRSTDVLDEIYAVLDYESLDRYLGKNIFSFGIYAGSLDDNPKYVTSRQNADIFFSRYKLSLTRVQRIFGYTNLMLRGTGQYTQYRLVPVEQIITGGYGTVRGHTTSLFIGDYGYYASSELMFAPPFIGDKTLLGQRVAQLAQLALFFDHGAVFTTDTQPGELDSEYLSGYGLGVRLFYKKFFSFKYDLGFPVDPRPPEDSFIHYFYFSFDFF